MGKKNVVYLAVILALVIGLEAFNSQDGGHGFAPRRQKNRINDNNNNYYVEEEAFNNGENCTTEVDLMIAIDGSNSITNSDWSSAVAFLYDVVLGFQLGPNQAQIGVVQFSFGSDTEVVVPLTDDLNKLQTGLQNMQKLGGGTNIAEGIIMSQAQITQNGRSGVPHVIIVITDGKQDDPYSPLNPVQAAGAAKLAGSTLFGIGVGDEVDVNTMEQIVNTPYQDYYFPVNSYSNLSAILAKTVLSVCHPSTTTASSAASAASQSSQSSQSSQTTGGSQSSQSSQTSQTSQTSQSGATSQSGGSTGGGTKCGNFNTCPFGDFCCSDGNNPNDPFYCCAGADRCCEGACCSRGYQCYNGPDRKSVV